MKLQVKYFLLFLMAVSLVCDASEGDAPSSGSGDKEVVSAIALEFQGAVSSSGFGQRGYEMLKMLYDMDTAEADAEIVNCFQMLASVGSAEAVMVIAEFLAHNTRRPREVATTEQEALNTIDAQAALVLGGMNLPDAPVRKALHLYTMEDVKIWREWLLAFPAQ